MNAINRETKVRCNFTHKAEVIWKRDLNIPMPLFDGRSMDIQVKKIIEVFSAELDNYTLDEIFEENSEIHIIDRNGIVKSTISSEDFIEALQVII